MAKVTGPLMSMGASGRFGAIVFDTRGFVRTFVAPANPQTVNQMTQRNTMGDIQRELKLLGIVLRGELKSGLGYRWNSLIIKELLGGGKAVLIAKQAEYAAFVAGDKTAWANADAAVPVELTDGEILYCVASALYDLCLRLAVTVSLTDPATGNSATVGGEWTANA